MNLEDLKEIPPWEWPENATSLVLETLANRNAPKENRLLASKLAGDVVILNKEIAGILLNMVESDGEPAELRSEAANSLGYGLEEADFFHYTDSDDDPVFSSSFVGKIQDIFRDLFSNPSITKNVRRSVLHASVRNPQDWHFKAVKSAFASDDADWRRTAVFCMRFVKGFDAEILRSLKSADPAIHYNAVEAAGRWELDAAWPHIAELVLSPKTEKPILLAAISAAASIRPHEADIIEPLVDSSDEDISEAATEALTEAGFESEWDWELEEIDDEDEFDVEDDLEDEKK